MRTRLSKENELSHSNDFTPEKNLRQQSARAGETRSGPGFLGAIALSAVLQTATPFAKRNGTRAPLRGARTLIACSLRSGIRGRAPKNSDYSQTCPSIVSAKIA